MSAKLDAALDLAELGYYVFQCAERGKSPLTRHGFYDATRDERTLLHAYERRPYASVAIACEASQISVLDVDPKYGADPAEAFAELDLDAHELVVAWTGEAPEPTARYPRSLSGVRGAHAYFRGLAPTGELALRGCELRSRRAYVIAPPSGHASGVQYEWHRRTPPPPPHELPPLPAALVPAPASTAPPRAGDTFERGRRHNALKALAVDLVRRGVVELDVVRGALLEVNRVRCRPPIDDDSEVVAIAEWAVSTRIAERERAVAEFVARWRTPREEAIS